MAECPTRQPCMAEGAPGWGTVTVQMPTSLRGPELRFALLGPFIRAYYVVLGVFHRIYKKYTAHPTLNCRQPVCSGLVQPQYTQGPYRVRGGPYRVLILVVPPIFDLDRDFC